MSVDLMRLCWRCEFPSPAMSAVAVKLADCANDDGENVYPSVGRIERETRLGASTVRRCLAAFEEAGLLEVVAEASGNKWNRSTTIRRFNMLRLHELSAVEVRRRGSVLLTPSTHVLKEIAAGNRQSWAIVKRGPGDASDYARDDVEASPPLPQRDGCDENSPSQSGRGPIPLREGAPPAAGANPSIEPPMDTPPPPPAADAAEAGGVGKGKVSSRGLKVRGPDWSRLLAMARSPTDRGYNLALDLLIAPVVTQRRLDAPTASEAVRAIAAAAAAKGLSDKALAAAAKLLLDTRKATVKPSDFDAALASAQVRLADKIEIRRGTHPRQWAAWLAWHERVKPTMGRMMADSSLWYVDSEWPPSAHATPPTATAAPSASSPEASR